MRSLNTQPVVFVGLSAHHSWIKASRACGLRTKAVRRVANDAEHRMDVHDLKRQLAETLTEGETPIMVCGTAGTTNAGIIDPLDQIGEVCREFDVWFHVDAAWGGAVSLVPEYSRWLRGIAESDSLTFDTHKFLSIPMSAGLFLTRHRKILAESFNVITDYMPRDAADLDVVDPYLHSMQWSRRFIGLKVFLPLAVSGWKSLTCLIKRQVELGNMLRKLLSDNGWRCVNSTALPVICFVDENDPGGANVDRIARTVVMSGQAWIWSTVLGTPSFVLALRTSARRNRT